MIEWNFKVRLIIGLIIRPHLTFGYCRKPTTKTFSKRRS